ncbi:Hypothetical_protein [Hexamita inflata]|uniref:Hypothetical_protein n=1 Tax=Hexamita inflata TaxID=28002 RepID=A0AA86TKJ9_9EUKA|nr:Hypothetical protein HINF_LOCUS3333 [Hexamita inflata]
MAYHLQIVIYYNRVNGCAHASSKAVLAPFDVPKLIQYSMSLSQKEHVVPSSDEIIEDGQQFNLVGTQFLAECGTRTDLAHYCAEIIGDLRSGDQCKRTQKTDASSLTGIFSMPDDNANDTNCVRDINSAPAFPVLHRHLRTANILSSGLVPCL